VIAAVIVVVDEVGDGAFEVTGQVVGFKQDAALEREVPSLDIGRATMSWVASLQND
jgi:hypothetical protein